jgi:hypothetical protein
MIQTKVQEEDPQHNILELVLEQPSKKEAMTTVDSKILVEPLNSYLTNYGQNAYF